MIRTLIKKLSRQLPVVSDKTNCFYYLAEKMLNDYETSLKSIDSDLLSELLSQASELRGIPTSKRFVSLIHRINIVCLEILQYAYKGQVLEATKLLDKLLSVPKYTDYKLKEWYCNYMTLNVVNSKRFYRIVDFSMEEDDPKDCNHVPFQLRKYASKGRYNLLGYPCLYLCSSLECANKEVGDLGDNDVRYYGEFITKKNLYFLDFTLPLDEAVDTMAEYDMFCFLVTYPIRLLCNFGANDPHVPFCEEYLFPQLFLHIMLVNKKDIYPDFTGISYSSVHDRECINYVIPAKYDSMTPQIMGHSQYILDNFEQISHQKMLTID